MVLSDEVIKKIIVEGDTKELVEQAKNLGAHLVNRNLTTSQIRNVFSAVKRMEMKGFNQKELLLLKPKLAYASSRPGAKDGTKDLKDILTKAINYVGNSKERFENFCNFFEAILAYHRAAGGK